MREPPPATTVAAVLLAAMLSGPPLAAQIAPFFPCGAGLHAGETAGTVLLPEGDVWCPLTADPKAEHTFVTYVQGDFGPLTAIEEDTEVASVGIGDDFPLVRWNGPGAGDGVQVGLAAAVFAQFDLRSASFDLINADYVVGIPVTIRRGATSARVRLYHQSSHVGDELLLRDDEFERENLSFESLEVLLSRELGPLRAYGGGEFLFRREPDELEEMVAHGGLEVRVGPVRGPSLVAALDLKSSEEQDWDPAWSARAGVELAIWREHGHPPRTLAFLLDFYDGPSPYGQFFQQHLHWFGLGLHLGL